MTPQRDAARADQSPGAAAPPPLIYLSGLIAGFALERVLPSPAIPARLRLPAGGALLAGGGLLVRSFVRAFGRADTPLSPYSRTEALVTGGPFRLSRNPGYLGLALVYSGTAVLAGTLWPLASLPPTLLVVDRGVIAREERYLEARFGERYLTYKREVRRWI